MSAASIADACEAALREKSTHPLLSLLHDRIHVTTHCGDSIQGIAEFRAWAAAHLSHPHGELKIVERYIDEPVAVIVLSRAQQQVAQVEEFTLALIAHEKDLIRILVDA